MGVLAKDKIVEHFKNNKLIVNANKDNNGNFIVEPASYDLRVGNLIWKELIPNTRDFNVITKAFNPNLPLIDQETVTLKPGQVMFVVTLEEVNLTNDICGTVYAKNRFSREGILAFTTGHVDPGIKCPIVIRLINLRAIPFVIQLGEPIYTIVFEELSFINEDLLESHKAITMEETLRNTRELANAIISNALTDLIMTQDFVKKNEFNDLKNEMSGMIKKKELIKILLKSIFGNFWQVLLAIFALIGAFATILYIIEFFTKK